MILTNQTQILLVVKGGSLLAEKIKRAASENSSDKFCRLYLLLNERLCITLNRGGVYSST